MKNAETQEKGDRQKVREIGTKKETVKKRWRRKEEK